MVLQGILSHEAADGEVGSGDAGRLRDAFPRLAESAVGHFQIDTP